MDKTPIHDPSMTPSASTNATTGNNPLQAKAMIYICADCHKDIELKSTDVIRCKINRRVVFVLIGLLCFVFV